MSPIGCYGEDKFHNPQRTPEEIVKYAGAAITSRKISVKDHQLNGLTYDYIKDNWYVSYSSKGLEVGGHFTILINDTSTDKTNLFPVYKENNRSHQQQGTDHSRAKTLKTADRNREDG